MTRPLSCTTYGGKDCISFSWATAASTTRLLLQVIDLAHLLLLFHPLSQKSRLTPRLIGIALAAEAICTLQPIARVGAGLDFDVEVSAHERRTLDLFRQRESHQ